MSGVLPSIAVELESVEGRCTEWPSLECQRAFKAAVSDAVSRINHGLIPRNLMLVELWTVYDEHVKVVYELARIRPHQVLARVEVHSMITGRIPQLSHDVYVVRALVEYAARPASPPPKKVHLSEFLP